jgi:FtsP/CotA-like multicopper oxidase with cupredoxin domain
MSAIPPVIDVLNTLLSVRAEKMLERRRRVPRVACSRRGFLYSSVASALAASTWLKSVHGQTKGTKSPKDGSKTSPSPVPGDSSGVPFAIRPFEAELPIPEVIQPVGVGQAPYTPGEVEHGIAPEFANLAQWERMPTKYYSLDIREAVHEFIPGVQTPVWTYGGSVPGPTFRSRIGEPAVVRFRNLLPVEQSVHLHGGHLPAHADGYPTFYTLPGKARDYFYPNTVPLHNGELDFSEAPSTAWYHDHAMDIAGHNVYMGLAGLHLYRDDLESNLIDMHVLPGDAYDIPLVLMDRKFNADGTLAYDFLDHNGQLGNVHLVNGKVQPKLVVERRKYRFRVCDAANARFYMLRLSSGQPFLQICNDSWMLPKALLRNEVFLSMGNRADLVIDFSNAPSELYLENVIQQTDGRGPDGKYIYGNGAGEMKYAEQPTRLLKFEVVGSPVANDARVAENTPLRPHTAIRADEIEVTRRFEFDRKNGAWVINGKFFDPGRADAVPRLGSAERWILTNGGGGWWHPVHIHLESHQLQKISGRVPPEWLRYKSDTTVLGPNDEAEIFMKFRTFPGPFAFHCHNLEHEDMRMMGVVDPRVKRVKEPTRVTANFS